MLNCLLDLGKRTRSLNHLVYIPKICYSKSVNFALEFSGRRDLKAPKKIYISHIKKRLESHLAFSASTASVITNYHYPIRERFESHLPSNYHQDLGTRLCTNQQQVFGFHLATTASSSFTNASDIPEVTLLPFKVLAIGHYLWYRHYCFLRIKNSIPADCNLCKYTWEVVVCMVLIGKRFMARYVAKNLSVSRKHGKHNEKNVEHRGNITTKS